VSAHPTQRSGSAKRSAVVLEGISQKFAWAKRHLNELTEVCPTYLEEHPYETICEFYPDAQAVGLFLATPDPGPKFGVAIGAIVYQLRSILDQIVWQLADVGGGNPPLIGGSSQFPIFTPGGTRSPITSPSDFDNRVKNGMLRGVPQPQRALIEAVQPYNSPNPALHPLAILVDLSNADKHNVIPVVTARIDTDYGQRHGLIIERDVASIDTVELVGNSRSKNGAVIIAATITPDGPDPQVKMYSEASRYIAFEQGWPLATTLYWLGCCVEEIFDALLPGVDDPLYKPPLFHFMSVPPKPVYRSGTPLPKTGLA
jgi:hypothetical protein